MGTFENIRKISPYLFGFFAVMLVAFFTIGDQTVVDGLTNSGDPSQRVIATVNGEDISYLEFETRVREQIEQQRQQNQDPNAEINEQMIRQQVWNQLVDQKLLLQAAHQAGIKISDETIKDIMIESPPDFIRQAYTDSTGQFRKDIYLEIITNPANAVSYMGDPSQMSPEEIAQIENQFRQDLINIEEYVKNQELTNKFTTLINTTNSFVSRNHAEKQYIMDKSFADINLIALKTDRIKDEEVEVSEAEILEYYNKNKSKYEDEEARKIKYATFRLIPNADDSARARRKVNRLLQSLESATNDEARDSVFSVKVAEYGGESLDYQLVNDIDPQKYGYMAILEKGKIAGPIVLRDATYFLRVDDRREGENTVVKASHILIGFGDNDNKDSAKTYANSILSRAKSGEDFAALAREYSEDKGSGAQGGDLGYFGEGRMVAPFEEAAFAADVNEIVGPVETQFGYHIIKVVDKKSEEIAYSQIAISPNMSSKTKRMLFRDAKSLQNQVDNGEIIDSLANKLGVPINETQYYTKDRSFLGSQYLTDLVFKADKGDVLEPLEINRFGYVVAQVSEVRREGPKPLQDVQEDIKAELIKKKKLDLLAKQADEIYSKVIKYPSMTAASNAETTLNVQKVTNVKINGNLQGVGKDAMLTAAIFQAEENKINPPFRGENGYYIFEVYKKTTPPADQIEENLERYVNQLKQKRENQAFMQWFSSFKENAEIEDNRSEFYREY